MRIRVSAILALSVLLTPLAPIYAHHAFEAEFDATKPVTLRGKVIRMEWINPHSWLHLAVTGPDGQVTEWMVEGGSPNIMLRRGFTKESLKEGDEIVAEGYRAKNGTNKANGSSITFADGKRLFVGGSNPDDPGAKNDPGAKKK